MNALRRPQRWLRLLFIVLAGLTLDLQPAQAQQDLDLAPAGWHAFAASVEAEMVAAPMDSMLSVSSASDLVLGDDGTDEPITPPVDLRERAADEQRVDPAMPELGQLLDEGSPYTVASEQIAIRILDKYRGTADLQHLFDTFRLEVVSLPGYGSVSGIYLVRTTFPSRYLPKIIYYLNRDPRILFAERMSVGSIANAAPFDNYIWGSYDPGQLRQQTAFNLTGHSAGSGQGGNGALDYADGEDVKVAIIDTGFDLDHPLLSGVWTDSSVHADFVDNDMLPEERANGLDDDSDGQIDEAHGHGTFVAGIVHLLAPEAEIIPIRALEADGQGHEFLVSAAINHAVLAGADIINLSLVLPNQSTLLAYEIAQAAEAGVLVIAAAGNAGVESPSYPAADACALGVAAVSDQKQKSTFSNYGSWVDLSMPGVQIVSSFPETPIPPGQGQGNYYYAMWSGSSIAAPFAAGQAALNLSVDGTLDPRKMSALLAENSEDLDGYNPSIPGRLGIGLPHITSALEQVLGGPDPNPANDLLTGCNPE